MGRVYSRRVDGGAEFSIRSCEESPKFFPDVQTLSSAFSQAFSDILPSLVPSIVEPIVKEFNNTLGPAQEHQFSDTPVSFF